MQYPRLVRCSILAAILIIVFATSASSQKDVLGEDVKEFESTWGAQVRLLMLEKSMTRNLFWGNEIIKAIEEKDSSADTGEMQLILAELEILKQEVESTNPTSGAESAKQFLDMKEDAKALTREFRSTAKSILTPANAKSLKQKLRGMNPEEIEGLDEQINKARQEYNAQKLKEILSAIGNSNPELVDNVRNGKLNMRDVKNKIQDYLANMNEEEEKQALQAIKEKNANGDTFSMEVAEMFKKGRMERARDRLESRLEHALNSGWSEEKIQWLRNRLEAANSKIESIQEQAELKRREKGITTESMIERLINASEKSANRTASQQDEIRKKLNSANITQELKDKLVEKLENITKRNEEMQGKIRQKIEELQAGTEKSNKGQSKKRGDEQ